MNGQNALGVNLASGEMAIVDKQKGSLVVYQDGAQSPAINIKSQFDIIALRDLLNDAYPPEVHKYDPMRRMPKRGIV